MRPVLAALPRWWTTLALLAGLDAALWFTAAGHPAQRAIAGCAAWPLTALAATTGILTLTRQAARTQTAARANGRHPAGRHLQACDRQPAAPQPGTLPGALPAALAAHLAATAGQYPDLPPCTGPKHARASTWPCPQLKALEDLPGRTRLVVASGPGPDPDAWRMVSIGYWIARAGEPTEDLHAYITTAAQLRAELAWGHHR